MSDLTKLNDPSISVVILTFNEEIHIERCIRSVLSICENIYVIDSFSQDKTVEIARTLGAQVYQRAWKNYADQFQWALDFCPIHSTWVMRLDADECLNSKMQESLLPELSRAPEEVNGVICDLRNVFMGKVIKYGGYDPLKLLRIWKVGRGRIESRWMDEHIVLDGGKAILASGEILHNNLNNHRWWTDKHNKYADREMVDILYKKYKLVSWDDQIKGTDNSQAKLKRMLKESVYNKLPVFLRPWLYFSYRYFIRLGFLDGAPGFAYHFFQALWYRTMVDARVYEAEMLMSPSMSKAERIKVLECLTGLELHED